MELAGAAGKAEVGAGIVDSLSRDFTSKSGRGGWIRTGGPLRPSGPELRFYATSCGYRSSFKSLVQRKLSSLAIAGDSSKKRVTDETRTQPPERQSRPSPRL